MKNQRLLLACTLGAFTLSHAASAELIDDFESYTTGNISNQSTAGPVGPGPWSSNGSSLADILAETGNQYLAFGWDDAGYRGAHRDLGPGIGVSDTSTLFFRLRSIDERSISSVGVTDVDNPSTTNPTFADFRAGVTLQDDGNASNGTFDLKTDTTTLTTGLSEGTWYNVWMVIDNATNTMDVYLNDGIGKPTTSEKLNGSPVSFLNGTANALDRFVTSGALSVNGGSQNVHVDDISLTAGALSPSLFFDDFETATVNSAIGTSGPWGSASSTPGNWIVRDETTADPFSAGTNQYLDLADGSATASIRLQSPNITEAVGAVTTFSFDFSEPTGGGDSNLILGYSNNNEDLNGSGSRQSINLNNGTISGLSSAEDNTYDLDTAYTLYMIFNDSGSELIYDGGTLADGEAHIWLEELDTGVFVFAGTSSEQNTATVATSYRVGFRSFSSFIQTVQVDNVELSLGAAAVPEPTSVALLGLGGLLLTRRRR